MNEARLKLLSNPRTHVEWTQNHLYQMVMLYMGEEGITDKELIAMHPSFESVLEGEFNGDLETFFQIVSLLGRIPYITYNKESYYRTNPWRTNV